MGKHNMENRDCGVCGKKRIVYIDWALAECSICGLEMCTECTYSTPYNLDTASVLRDDLEWELFHTILATFATEPPVVCNKCFEVRAREILRTSPIDDMGLLVNATLIPLQLIKDRLSTG
jgi:hypothetical protein